MYGGNLSFAVEGEQDPIDRGKSSLSKLNMYISGQIITTSAEVTLNGGLIRELPQNPRNIQV